jgi:hypothetical protein
LSFALPGVNVKFASPEIGEQSPNRHVHRRGAIDTMVKAANQPM